jgi:hypothetical protein
MKDWVDQIVGNLRAYFAEAWARRREELSFEVLDDSAREMSPDKLYRLGVVQGYRRGYWDGAKDCLEFSCDQEFSEEESDLVTEGATR